MARLLTFVAACFCFAALDIKATAAPTDAHPAIEWEQSEAGEAAFVPMESAPYPHPSRDKGHVFNKTTIPREPHYTDSTVGLFVPRGFRKTPKVHVLVYLHGWSNNVRKALLEFKLREQIAASGQNVVLVFPEGPRDATDSGCGKLEDKDGLRRLVEESLKTLHAAGKIEGEEIGQVLIAGHSGAYLGLAAMADHGGLDGKIAGVCLLDASYGNLDLFVKWVEKHPRGRLFSIFTDHLSAQNVYLFTHLQKIDPQSAMRIDTEATDEMLAEARTLFLHTETLKHDETVRWLERWLRTRELD